MYQPFRPAKTIFIILGILLCPLLLPAQQQVQYDIQVNPGLSAGTFSVKGNLSFLADPGAGDSVAIMLSKCPAPPVLRLRTPGIQIERTDTTSNEVGDILYHMKFTKELPAGARLEFAFEYERGARPSFQYYIDSAFCMAGGYGSAWYPQVASRAEDGSNDRTRGTGTISVTLPVELTPVMAASTLRIAASGQMRTYSFHYDVPDIFSLYIGPYQRQEIKGTLPFYCFTLSKDVDGAALSARASGVMSYLVSQFGPLDIPNFTIIEFPDAVSERTGIGGASIMGGIVMPANALKRFNYALFGHELSHQWWGNKVLARGEKGAEMLCEGMAQYGSLQVVQQFDSAQAILYRRTGYPGYIPDQSGFGYLKNAAAGIDAPLADLTNANGHTIGDSKGFLVLELLSNTIGKDLFHKTLRLIGDKYKRSGLSWQEFLQELETAHGSSLQWFYDQWFCRKGAPAWQSSWQQQGQELQLTVRQTDSIYRLPLEVQITYAGGQQELQQVTVQAKEQLLKLPVTGRVTAVKIDPYFKVIHWDEELTPMAREMSKVQRVQQLRIEQKTAEAEQLALAYLAEGFPEDRYGVEFSLLYAVGRMKGIEGKNEEALSYYQQALRCAVRFPDLLANAYYRIALIAKQQKDDELFRWACAHAIKADVLNNGKDGMQAKIRQL